MSRRRYRWDPEAPNADGGKGAMVEIGAEWEDAPRRAPVATEQVVYGHLQASDGTPLDSRRKHREYMERNGLALYSDFTETRVKEQERRKRERREGSSAERQAIREAAAQAFYQIDNRKGHHR